MSVGGANRGSIRRNPLVAIPLVVAAVAVLWFGVRSVPDVGSGRPIGASIKAASVAARSTIEPAVTRPLGPPPMVVADLTRVPRVERSQVITDGTHSGKMVALTFDDNYAPDLALPVLEALDRARAPATLFLVGGATRSYPDVTARIAQNPLVEVGDHSGSHADLTRLDGPALEREIGAGVTAYRELTGGHASRLFRAPGGHVDEEVLAVAAQKGYPFTVAFDPGPPDYEGVSADTIVEEVRRRVARSGGIVLLHFNAPHTAEALPDLVFSLRARGYRLVTVSELLRGDRLWFDVDPQDPAYEAILTLARAGLMRGFPTGDYGAYEPMSRADLAVVLTRVLGQGDQQDTMSGGGVVPQFSDVTEGLPGLLAERPGLSSEAVSAIESVTDRGLMEGGVDVDGRRVFWPHAAVRRADLAAAVTAAAAEWLPEGSTAAAAVDFGFMDDPADGLSLWEPMGRAEVAATVHRLMQVVAPDLIGRRGLPAWWRGAAAP